jgi:hypothetical protein
MSVDRFEAINRPLIGLSWSKKRGLTYIAIAFVCAHLQGIPQIIFFSLRYIPGFEPPVQTCYADFQPKWLQNAYIVYTWLMQFFIPLVIIVCCYASISVKVFDSIKNKSNDKDAKKSHLKKMYFDDEATKCLKLENALEPVSNDIENMSTSPHKKTNAVKNTSFRQHCAKNFSKSKMKTIKLTMTVIALYIICSTPYFIGLIMNLMLKQDNYILSRIYQE